MYERRSRLSPKLQGKLIEFFVVESTAGYSDPLDIALDVMAIKAAGLDDVSVFSLDGMLLEGGIDRWLDAASGPTVAVPIVDPLAALVPFLFDLADGVLDE